MDERTKVDWVCQRKDPHTHEVIYQRLDGTRIWSSWARWSGGLPRDTTSPLQAVSEPHEIINRCLADDWDLQPTSTD